MTTFAVGNNTSVTITAFFDTTTSANLHRYRRRSASPTPPPSPHTSGSRNTFSYTWPAGASLISPAADAPVCAWNKHHLSIGAMSPGRPATPIQIDDQDTFPSPLIVNQTGNHFSIQHQHAANAQDVVARIRAE